MRLPKIIALLYVFSTNTVASKKIQSYLKRTHRKRCSKEMKDVLMKEQYVQFVDLALKPNSEEDDFAMTMWSMDLSKRTRREFIRVLKEDYKGSPKTRHQAKVYASQASPRVRKAWKCYNRMLQTDLSILQILNSINTMNISLWSYDELVLFDELIDTQMTFNAIEDFKYCNWQL